MSEKIVQLNEEAIKGQIKELVRGSVEKTLNELLEAEAENRRLYMEEQERRKAEREATRKAEADRVMQAGRAPEPEPPKETPQKIETVEEPVNVIDFRVYATMAQLMRLKTFLNDNGIRFEPVPKN